MTDQRRVGFVERVAFPVPELDVFDADGAEFGGVVRIEFHVEDFVLVTTRVDERLGFTPVPKDQRMIVVEADGSQELAAAGKVQAADASRVLTRKRRQRGRRADAPHFNLRVFTHLTRRRDGTCAWREY